MCAYSPIPRARDTPSFSATPWYTLSSSGSRGSPAAETTAPAPELLNRPAPAGRGNAQNRHSNRRSPTAPTEIFNSPLNLTGKGNCPRRIGAAALRHHRPAADLRPDHRPICEYLRISPNISQMLCFAPAFSHSLAFLFAVSPSSTTLSVEASIYNLSGKY